MTHIAKYMPDPVKALLRPTYSWARARLLHWRFKSAEAGLPPSLTFAATFKCLAACPHCMLLQENPELFAGGRKFPAEKFLEVLNAPYAANVRDVTFGGGEALQHPRLFDWLDELNRRGVKAIQVVTNGMSLREEKIVVELIERGGFTNLHISLDATNEADYVHAKGLKKVDFQLILKNIARIAAAYRDRPDVRIGSSFVIGAHNIDQVSEMVALAEKLGVSYAHFTTLHLTDQGNIDVAGETIRGGMPKPYVDLMGRSDYTVEISIQPPISDDNMRYWCESLANHLPVSVTGEVAPCCHIPWHEKYGNVFNVQDGENPINNSLAVEMRKAFIHAAEKDDPSLLPNPCQMCNRRLKGTWQFLKDGRGWTFLHY